MSLVTIFTPTYNRAYILPRLYESLCRQTDKDFEWLIIDDGSSDNTKDIIDKWSAEKKIKINYFFQENSGKMKAHNCAVKNIRTKWFLCIDSDDYIVDTCIEKIKAVIKETESEIIAGIVAYRGNNEYEKLGGYEFPKVKYSTLSNLYKKGFRGDTTLIFKSDVIKKYYFPNIEGEKFMTEAYIYDQIDQNYKLYVLSEILTICQYREDGYTCNINRVYFENPISMMTYYEQAYKFEDKLIKKMKIASNFSCYFIEAKNKKKDFKFKLKFLYIVMYIPGMILRYKRKGMMD